jgi:hypothetical protein
MAETPVQQRSDMTFPTLPVYWRRVLAVSLSDLEEELFISLHHPLQPERVLNALSHHARLIRGLIGHDHLCPSHRPALLPSRKITADAQECGEPSPFPYPALTVAEEEGTAT